MILFHMALPSPMRYGRLLEREYLQRVKQLQKRNMGVKAPASTNVRVWLSLGRDILKSNYLVHFKMNIRYVDKLES